MRHGDSRYPRGLRSSLSSLSLCLSPSLGRRMAEARGIHARGKRRYMDYEQIDTDRKTVEREDGGGERPGREGK